MDVDVMALAGILLTALSALAGYLVAIWKHRASLKVQASANLIAAAANSVSWSQEAQKLWAELKEQGRQHDEQIAEFRCEIEGMQRETILYHEEVANLRKAIERWGDEELKRRAREIPSAAETIRRDRERGELT